MNRHLDAALLTLMAVCLLAGRACCDTVVLVADPQLRPVMAEWVTYRRSPGRRFVWIDPDALRRSWPDLPPETPTGDRPITLVLVGDADRVPTAGVRAEVISRFGPEQNIASDQSLADRLGADAVGRLPMNDPEELRTYLRRLIQREQTPATWDDLRLQIAAGVGGFSPIVDHAIEGAAGALVRQLAPPAASLSLARHTPGTPRAPSSPTGRGGVWVWMGHGQRDRLPGIDRSSLVDAVGGADVAVLLACYAGDYSTQRDCVAECLVRDPDGPLAVIAATGVSMPYGNARIGAELLTGWCEDPATPIGLQLGRARRAAVREPRLEVIAGLDRLAGMLSDTGTSLEAERRDHTRLYNLLGDPLIPIDRVGRLTVEAPTLLGESEELVVRGVAPAAGRLCLEVLPVRPAVGGTAMASPLGMEVRAGERYTTRLPATESWRRGTRTVRVGLETSDGVLVSAVTVRRAAAGVQEPAQVASRAAPESR